LAEQPWGTLGDAQPLDGGVLPGDVAVTCHGDHTDNQEQIHKKKKPVCLKSENILHDHKRNG
jgi:hypothetical protein